MRILVINWQDRENPHAGCAELHLHEVFGGIVESGHEVDLLWGGVAGAATDAIFVLQPVLSSYNGKGDGDFNYGRYTNPRIDELTAKIKVDMNAAERLDLIHQAFLAHNAEINHLPLHRQVIPWASRSNVSVQHRPDNGVIPMWATLK